MCVFSEFEPFLLPVDIHHTYIPSILAASSSKKRYTSSAVAKLRHIVEVGQLRRRINNVRSESSLLPRMVTIVSWRVDYKSQTRQQLTLSMHSTLRLGG